jgi:hypothetical protein
MYATGLESASWAFFASGLGQAMAWLLFYLFSFLFFSGETTNL